MFIKKNWKRIVLILLSLLLIVSTIYTIYVVALYKSIETSIRVLGCITICVLMYFLILLMKKFKKKEKATIYIGLCIFILIYSLGMSFASYKINSVYNKIAKVSEEKDLYLSASVVARADDSAKKISDLKDKKLARISDMDDYEGYTLGNKILEENKMGSANILDYDDYSVMLKDLLSGKINYAIVPTNYTSMYNTTDGLEDLEEKTKIIYSKKEKATKANEITNNKKEAKSLNEPFTVLIMGVDTTNDGFQAGFNGDALILVTFNPTTMNATILSVPRDTYMPLSCLNNRKNKITNAGWRGQDCIINSLENYFGITIDYHVKINFNGVVGLVNALGGVEVDVPYAFCEQNSARKWGKNTVFVKSGKQTLNGEQALAFARHRKVTAYMRNYCGSSYIQNAGYWNDFTRGQNQQVIINAMIKKFKDIDNFQTIEKILDTISKNIETDIATKDILSLYNMGKAMLAKSANKDEAFLMQKLYLSGGDAMIYDYSFKTNSGSKLTLYNYVVYEESKNAVVKAMKENLGLISPTPVKKFSFSIRNKYTEPVIGKNVGSTMKLNLMPNLVGQDVSRAEEIANAHGLVFNVNYVNGTNGQKDGTITSQSIPFKTDLDMANTLTVSVVKNIEIYTPAEPTPNENIEETTNDNAEEENSNNN